MTTNSECCVKRADASEHSQAGPSGRAVLAVGIERLDGQTMGSNSA
jgi:hypothetical protein